MSWLKKSINESFFRHVAETPLAKVDQNQMSQFVAANLEIEGYGTAWGLFRGDVGTKQLLSPVEAKSILTQSFMQVASSHDATMRQLYADAGQGNDPFIEVNYDPSNEILVCNYNGMPVGQGIYQFATAVNQQGVSFQAAITPRSQRERNINRRNRVDDLSQVPENEYLKYANEVGYLVANGRVELDHPRHAKEKYTSSFHYTVPIRGNATRSKLFDMGFLSEYLPQERSEIEGMSNQEYTKREGQGIRITKTEGVESLLDYINLSSEIDLSHWRGAVSDNIHLSKFKDIALQRLQQRTPANVSREDVQEWFDLGFNGNLA